jgi:hypothetical protein
MRRASVFVAALLTAACIPADDTPDLGSVKFALGSHGVEFVTADAYRVRFDRIELGFKTMTIGKEGAPDQCAYKGRGATSNAVFDPRIGITQTFNGLNPVNCPDVGVILGPPDGATTIAPGSTSADLVELATPPAAHAIVEATVTPEANPGAPAVRIKLRFDERSATRFAGCGARADSPTRGVQIESGQRALVSVRFAAENLLRSAIATDADLRVEPLLVADAFGDRDGTVTMADLDALPLAGLGAGPFYELSNGSRQGSLGTFVRELFSFTIQFRTDSDYCLGIPPPALQK